MNPQRQLLLGIFFIIALAILAFYTLFLTDISLFSQPNLMTVYFPEANNLREGDPVQLLGARIGRVKEVSPNLTAEERRRIRVVLSLDREVELLEDAVITIRETSLLGGRNVFIDPGKFGGPVMTALEDGAFYGQLYKNPIASLGDIGTLLNENREEIDTAIRNLREITDALRTGKGLLGQLIVDEGLAGEVKEVVTNVRDATQQLKSGQGVLGALFYDAAARQKFDDLLENARQVSADLRNQEGVLGALLNDGALRERVVGGLDSFVSFVKELDEGEGALPMLMKDVETREQVRKVIADASAAFADVATLVADARAGQGTLGKLLTQDEIYADLRKALGVLTRSLEDYREAAPITAFTSVLFAAF